jgi:AcrR family transcriptional regulator
VNVIHIHEANTRATDRREAKTEAILARAMEILEADGLDALTLQRLATSLGLVTTGIYRYFPSKDALMAALQRRAVRVIAEHFRDSLRPKREALSGAAPADACLAALNEVADLYLALPSTHPHEWQFVALLLGDPRPLLSEEEASRTAPLLEGFLHDMEGLFQSAAATGALSPGNAAERVFAYWSALHGAHAMDKVRRISKSAPAVEHVGRIAARALLQSWKNNEPRTPAFPRAPSRRHKVK